MSRREYWLPPEQMADGTVRIRTIPRPRAPTPAELMAPVTDAVKRIDAQLARLEQRLPRTSPQQQRRTRQ